MKKRSLLMIVAMLSVLLLGIGTAHAVFGVDDAVPGQDLIIPIICGVDPANTVNTLWAIADKDGGTPVDIIHGYVARGHYTVHERIKSTIVKDEDHFWTPFDVVVDDCKALVNRIDPTNKAKLVTNINGVNYYVGYLKVAQQSTVNGFDANVTNRFVPWVYLVDAPNGYAAGFNGFSAEDGIGPELEEGGTALVAVTARHLFPRYIIENAAPQSRTWWILLAGRADFATFTGDPTINVTRKLDCVFCDEEEDCGSNFVPIPNEMNVINVADFLPSLAGHPNAAGEKNGFAICDVLESGTQLGAAMTIRGTFNPTVVQNALSATSLPNNFYTLLGWAHEKAQAASILASWDVIHPMHRTYCTLSDTGTNAGPNGSGIDETCSCTGACVD